MSLQLFWVCEGDCFGTLATDVQRSTFVASIASTSRTWNLAVFLSQPATMLQPEKWGASLSRFETATRRQKLAMRLSVDPKPSGFWTFGGFASRELATAAVETYLALRIDPATWTQQPPPIPHDGQGHFTAEEAAQWVRPTRAALADVLNR